MTVRVRVQRVGADAAEYDLDTEEVVIGRAETSAVVVPDGRVSRRHARLILRDGQWWVEDLGARNPTLLNGAAIAAATRIAPGDRLGIGDSIVQFVGDPASAPAAVAVANAATTVFAPLVSPQARDAARLRVLNDIHRALSEPISLADLLDLVLARCFEVIPAEEGIVLLRGPDGTISPAAMRGGRGGVVTVPRRLVAEIAGKAQPALVVDAAYDDRFAGSQSMMSSGFRSIVAAPLVDGEGTLGLIALCSQLAVRRFSDDDLAMLVSIASGVALRVRNVALADALAAHRVAAHELALAHEVQMSMLPKEVPATSRVRVGRGLKPARSVGGDLYDFVLDRDRLWFIVADVAGKSIAAALYVAIVKTLFRALARGDVPVGEVAERLNQELARDNERMMFVTALIGRLDTRTGLVELIDAGHMPPLLVTSDGTTAALPDLVKGIAFGVVADASYVPATWRIAAGTTLAIYTDGFVDARSSRGEAFGMDRLRATVGANAGREAAALVAAVLDAVERFSAGAAQEDDLAMLALQFVGE